MSSVSSLEGNKSAAGMAMAAVAGLALYAGFHFYSGDHADKQGKAKADQLRNQYVGLPNLGNTCYMSSLLQFLSGCPEYKKYLEEVYSRNIIEDYRKNL